MFRKMYKTIVCYFLFFCISLMPVWAETKAKAEEKPDLNASKVDVPKEVEGANSQPKRIKALQLKVDLALAEKQKEQAILENKMIVIDRSIAALEEKRVAAEEASRVAKQKAKLDFLNNPAVDKTEESIREARASIAAKEKVEELEKLYPDRKPDLSYLKVDMPYAVARAKLIQNGWSFYDYGVKTYDQILPACLERKFPGTSKDYREGHFMEGALVCLYLPEFMTSSSEGYITMTLVRKNHYLRITAVQLGANIYLYHSEYLPVTGWRLMDKDEVKNMRSEYEN